MKFNSAEGMYHYLCNNGDLYNPVKEVYIPVQRKRRDLLL